MEDNPPLEHPDAAKNREISSWTEHQIENMPLLEFRKLTSTNMTSLFERMRQLRIDRISGFTLEEIGKLIRHEVEGWQLFLRDYSPLEILKDHSHSRKASLILSGL